MVGCHYHDNGEQTCCRISCLILAAALRTNVLIHPTVKESILPLIPPKCSGFHIYGLLTKCVCVGGGGRRGGGVYGPRWSRGP